MGVSGMNIMHSINYVKGVRLCSRFKLLLQNSLGGMMQQFVYEKEREDLFLHCALDNDGKRSPLLLYPDHVRYHFITQR